MNTQTKRELTLEASSIRRRAAQHITFLRQVILDIDEEVHWLENMILPPTFQKDITVEGDRNALITVSAIGSSITHIQVTIAMLRNQRILAEGCLKNAEPSLENFLKSLWLWGSFLTTKSRGMLLSSKIVKLVGQLIK